MGRTEDTAQGRERAVKFMALVREQTDTVVHLSEHGAFDLWVVNRGDKACTIITQAFPYGGFDVYAPVSGKNSIPATVQGILGKLK